LAATVSNLAFLTILHEPAGYVGGYLVTNLWGRPLEFRLSTAVQPNRVQQILYGNTLEPYLASELIGKTLVDKTATQAQILFTDMRAVLDLRLLVPTPVAHLTPPDPLPAAYDPVWKHHSASSLEHSSPHRVLVHPQFPDDLPAVRALVERLERHVDFLEPFARIREAVQEARKLGVTNRN
jgi:hypothetical protein